MRRGFNSRFGAIAASAGSAIGLGNIWRFPYVAGENGGGAFLFIYLIIILVIGLPMLISEFTIGRYTQKNIFGTFNELAPKKPWYLIGVLGIVSAVFVLSFYVVVSGWTVSFLIDAITGAQMSMTSGEITESFKSFSTSGTEPLIYIILFLLITAGVVAMGIQKGIERSNKVLMPMLLLILFILCVNSFTLDGFKEGVSFIFKPDFSKITTDVVLNALGQAFFSLSIGMGTMMTYGSYIRKQDNMLFTASSVAFMDIFIALLAGIAIFPAVFTFGIEPASGPDLVFITLPNIFAQMPGGYFLGILFFLLLFVAALTSAISVMEVVIASLTEEFKWGRMKSVAILTLVILVTGTFASLSLNPDLAINVLGVSLFDIFDKGVSLYLMPIGGLFIMLFAGWVFGKERYKKELSSSGTYNVTYYFTILRFIIKFVAPVAIAVIFMSEVGFL